MKSVFKSKKVITVFTFILIVVALIITAVISNGFSDEARAKRKIQSAEKYVTELNYEDAILAYEEAIKLDPRNMDTYLALAEVYVTREEPEKAILVLERGITVAKGVFEEEKLILKNCDSLYIRECDLLFDLGRIEEALEKAKEGLNFIRSPLLEEYFSKVSPSVSSSLPEGKYEEEKSVELSTMGTKIYYTTDGSEPNTTSDVYTEPIKLENGKTKLKAVAESEFETLGEVCSFSYSMIYVPQEVKEVVYQLYESMKEKDFERALNIAENNEKILSNIDNNVNSNIKLIYDGTNFSNSIEGTGLVVAGVNYADGERNYIYYGDIINDTANGTGSLIITHEYSWEEDGHSRKSRSYSSYYGEFVNGLANGKGKLIEDDSDNKHEGTCYVAEGTFNEGYYSGKVNAESYDVKNIYRGNIEFYVVDGILDKEANIKNNMGDNLGDRDDYDKIIWFKVSSKDSNGTGLYYGTQMVHYVYSGWHN